MAPSTEKKKKSFCQNFKSHLTPNRALLPLKLVMFLFYGGATIFLPYVTLHMLQVGITVQEVGIIYAILPFAACFGPPTAGMIADKLGNYKVVLMAAIVLNSGFHTLLTMIDAHGIDPAIVRATNQMSSVFINCGGLSGQANLEWSTSCANDTCPYENSFLTEATLRLMPANCIHSCAEGSTETDSKFCLAEEAGCRTLDKSIHLKMTLSESKRTESSDTGSGICSMTIDELMLFDSAQSQSPLLDNSTITKVSMTCDCPMRCPATLIHPKNSCSTNQTVPEYDYAKHNRGFWLYLIVRILATASLGTSWVMLDASTLCLIKKHKGDLGKQRLFGVIGSAVFGLLSGIVLDWASSLNNGVKDYAISFYFADAVFVVVLFILVMIEVSAEKAQGSLLKNVASLVKFIHIDMFLLILLTLGTFWGFLEAFLFVFLVELKATSYLLGMTVTVGALVGIPFLFVSDIIVKKVGPLVVLISAFFLYSLRFIGYSFIQDPWLSLPFEALEIVTIHLMGVAFSLFCASAAPVGLLATLQGMAGAMHYSIGRGIGSFVGGTLIAIYGTRVTFQILGTSASIFGVFFIIIYLTVLRKYERKIKPKQQEPEQKHLNVIFYPVNNMEDPMNVDEEETRPKEKIPI